LTHTVYTDLDESPNLEYYLPHGNPA